ncbi:hypothetical protein Asp14428_33290 [Actinoplanes sp. NBRC 14428]|nr:hypothetical protein Asp14428_33290 [Actinoplanes sp. NBRC 14428]
MHSFTLADGTPVTPLDLWDGDEREGSADSDTTKPSRLTLGEQFAYLFDFGDDWTHLCTVAERCIDPRTHPAWCRRSQCPTSAGVTCPISTNAAGPATTVSPRHRHIAGSAPSPTRTHASARGYAPWTRSSAASAACPAAPTTPNHTPARYRDIERLSRLILDDRSTLPTDAGAPGVSVMFNMTPIWEDYVGTWLRRRFPSLTVAAKHPIPLTDTGRPSIAIADFVLHQGSKPIAVYDAKYRRWQSRPSTNEIYQLCTYAQRLGISQAALVYPAAESVHTTTTVEPVTIDCWAVPIEDLGQQ